MGRRGGAGDARWRQASGRRAQSGGEEDGDAVQEVGSHEEEAGVAVLGAGGRRPQGSGGSGARSTGCACVRVAARVRGRGERWGIE